MSDDEWVRKMYRLLGTTPSEVHLRVPPAVFGTPD